MNKIKQNDFLLQNTLYFFSIFLEKQKKTQKKIVI
jgi:hypothetical protein